MGIIQMEVLVLKTYNDIIPNQYTGILIYPAGTKVWMHNGNKHREDGPALIMENLESGYKKIVWYRNGFKHRVDGPAVEIESVESGSKYEWYFNGDAITPEELFNQMTSEQQEKALWELNKWTK